MRSLVVFGLWLTCIAVSHAGDWRQFRGTESNGLGDDQCPPTHWSATENIAWKKDLPGTGLSSPIVVGDRVIVTCASGFRQDRLQVLCFAVKDGSLLWERQYSATGRTSHYSTSSVASSTPASDGKLIFAMYSSNDVACLDLDGNLQWYRGLTYDHPNASNSLGMASSPIVVGSTLIAQVENDSESLATGIDTATGVSRWTSVRPKKANWSSAILWPKRFGGNEDLALLQSSSGIDAVRPLTGEVVWKYTDGASTIPSSVVAEGVVYAVSNGITALKPPTDSASIEQIWREGKLGPGTGSPVAYKGRLYSINRAGVLLSADLKTGAIKWQERIPGPFSGSPVVAGDHLFVFSEKGEGHCVKLDESRGELVSTADMDGETIMSTPALSNGALFVRSNGHLWKIAEKK